MPGPASLRIGDRHGVLFSVLGDLAGQAIAGGARGWAVCHATRLRGARGNACSGSRASSGAGRLNKYAGVGAIDGENTQHDGQCAIWWAPGKAGAGLPSSADTRTSLAPAEVQISVHTSPERLCKASESVGASDPIKIAKQTIHDKKDLRERRKGIGVFSSGEHGRGETARSLLQIMPIISAEHANGPTSHWRGLHSGPRCRWLAQRACLFFWNFSSAGGECIMLSACCR